MQLVHVATAAVNQTPLAWDENRENILEAIAQAKDRNVSILCLPELCITGYGCEDAFHASGVLRTAAEVLEEIVPHTKDIVVSVGLPRMHGDGIFNTSCLISDAEIIGFAAKQTLAGMGVHYEPRWFKAWKSGVCGYTELSGRKYPIGDLLFDCGGVKIGFEICEDAWTAKRPGRNLALAGADLLLNPSASHFAFGKQEIRKRLVLDGSRAFGVNYLYSNLLGNESGRMIYDGSTLIASDTKLLAAGKRFSFEKVQLISAHIDIEASRSRRTQMQEATTAPTVSPEQCVKAEFQFPKTLPAPTEESGAEWEESTDIKEEEFTRAVALGLFDYLRKSRSRGFVVSLSGGCDSSSVATLVTLAIQLGIEELGRERFIESFSHREILAQTTDVPELVAALLRCVYQSTRNSGEVTRKAAQGLSTALGATFYEWDIDSLVDGYTDRIENAVGRKLEWSQDDLALQNVQARARAPGVWMLANLTESLLLTTSNRSEAAVGYATMDGDTSGGLAPIAGIDKAFLRRWLRWMEEKGPSESGPIAALKAVNQQQPTAELRPPGEKQTDESDLMPYELLDVIERAAIRDKYMPLEVYQLLRAEFPQYGARQLERWTVRFFKLWSCNQWKRERYAPSFHLDDENLDPKTWCRFPILSGGFSRELAVLREWTAAHETADE